uniref:angiopoietin-related protein 3-like n=1 Tax=Myxine glutinosa TaxID=7769 RepID=UPI00358F6E35
MRCYIQLLSVLLLVVLCISGLPNRPGHALPTDKLSRKPRYALEEEVNLVSYGLIQLGSTFKHYMDKVTGQVNGAMQSIREQAADFLRLEATTSELRSREQRLAERTQILEESETALRQDTERLYERLEAIAAEEIDLARKMERLEKRLNNGSAMMGNEDLQPDIVVLKSFFDGHSKTLSELLSTVQEQRDQIEQQTLRIRELEKKVKVTRRRRKWRQNVNKGLGRNRRQRVSTTQAVPQRDRDGIQKQMRGEEETSS